MTLMLTNYQLGSQTVNISAEGTLRFAEVLSVSGGGNFFFKGKKGLNFESQTSIVSTTDNNQQLSKIQLQSEEGSILCLDCDIQSDGDLILTSQNFIGNKVNLKATYQSVDTKLNLSVQKGIVIRTLTAKASLIRLQAWSESIQI